MLPTLKHNAMAYPNDANLRARCKLQNKPAIFYHHPAKSKDSREFAKHIRGKPVPQAYPGYLLKNFNWWSFVHRFSRVFAEVAEGDCYLLSTVPYKAPEGRSVWVETEYPALKANPNITSIICVDVADYTKRQVIYSRGAEGAAETQVQQPAT